MQAIEQIEHDLSGGRIQIPSRFVGQQQLRIVRQCTGDRHPLPLADGKLRGQMFASMRHPNRLQECRRFLHPPCTDRPVSNIGICTFSTAVNVGSR